jgi:hippurate hydrolase
MLLGAAKYLSETRNFRGRVALIFQPAEEDGGGADIMCREGIMDRFGIKEVYAIHTTPALPLGHFQTTPGPIMAAVDSFDVHIKGKGGHGAYPHECVDPVIAAVHIAQALQSIVSRNHYALQDLVVSVTMIHTGTAENIIPDTAYLGGTVRSFDPDVRDMVEARMGEIVAGQGASFGVEAVLDYKRSYPATVNDPAKTEFAVGVAEEIVGQGAVDGAQWREMGAEDFSYMLEERPGAYLFLGQGEAAGLHHPRFNFNDEAAPYGASFFARLVERALPLG